MIKMKWLVTSGIALLVAWKYHVIVHNKGPPIQPLTDLSKYDLSLFNTSSTFRVIDKDCKINIQPNIYPGDIYIAVTAKSAPDNFKRRQLTRELDWSVVPEFRGRVQIFFTIGATNNTKVQKEIEEESAKYGDILQYSLPDGYRLLPYKTIIGLLWLNNNLNHARYVGSMDDDQILDTKLLIDILEEKFPGQSTPDHNAIQCIQKFTNFRPNRDIRHYGSKWSLSYEDYAPDKWPPHCYGWFLLLGADLAGRIGIAASDPEAPYLFMDDIYFTGILRERVGASIDWLAKGKWNRWILDFFSPCYAFNWYRLILFQNLSYPRNLPENVIHWSFCPLVEKLFNVFPCKPVE